MSGKVLIWLYICLFTCNISDAQCFFQKVYDFGLENNFGVSVVQNNENKFTVLCKNSGSDYTITVLNISECGDTLWSKTFNFVPPPAGDNASNIIEVSDGFVITGSHGSIPLSDGAVSYLLKLGTNGDSIWYYDYNIGYNNWAQKNLQTTDGGFIVAGYRNDSVVTNVPTFLFKTNSNGILEWSNEYNDTPATSNYLRALGLTKDGGYFLMGQYANQNTQSYDYFLIKTDNGGNQQWKKNYGSPTIDEEPKNGITTFDGGFILCGYSAYRTHLIKVDTMGFVEWEKFYGDSGIWETAKAIRQLPDSSYIVACGGNDYVYSNNQIIRLKKIDVSGNLQWERFYAYYRGTSILQTYVEDIKITNDKGYVMTGYIINNNVPQKNDAWVLKVDSLGNICYHDSTVFNVWNPGCSQYDCNYIQAEITAPDTVYKDSSAQFFGNNSFATQWQWDFGEGNSDTLQNPVHTYDSVGEFTVTLTVSNGSCSDTAMATVVVVNWVGMENLIMNNNEFRIYPNPASEYFYFESNFFLPFEFNIYNIFGKEVARKKLYSNNEKINISFLCKGIYAVTITDNNRRVYIEKIVVE